MGGAYAAVTYRVKKKNQEKEVLMEVTNLHGYGHRSENRQTRRRSTWGVRRRSSTMDDFRDLNVTIGVEVRNSASGGWHGVYDDDQLQAISFEAPGGSEGGGDRHADIR